MNAQSSDRPLDRAPDRLVTGKRAEEDAAELALRPQTLDVVVASNLHGDILSDLGSALAGSLGLAASANPCHTPTAAMSSATGVPGPTRASTYPARGAKGRTGCRLALTC